MKYTVLVLVLTSLAAWPASAQQLDAPEVAFTPKSPGKAVLLSLAVPGLGHRYVHDGSWRGAATVFALADAFFWLRLIGAEWRYDQAVDSYRALAASRAGADLAGKDRRFFLNLGTFMSSDEFLAVQLRNRTWNQIEYVSDPAFQWAWASEADFRTYRDLRDDADAFSRRRTIFLSTLVANRLVAALTALRAARQHNAGAPDLALSFALPPPEADVPMIHLRVRW